MPTSRSPLDDSPMAQASDADDDRAVALMEQEWIEAGRRRSQISGIKDGNAVLSKIACGKISDATPRLVECLLDYGANVSIAKPRSSGLFNNLRGKNQVDIRSDILECAAVHCSNNIFAVLAHNADDVAVNQALPVAIHAFDAAKVTILLDLGADATPHCGPFMTVVESGPGNLVEALLRADRGACVACRDTGLIRAVERGHTVKARLLIRWGANLSYGNGRALILATEQGDEELATAIVSHPSMSQHPALLERVAKLAYDKSQLKTLQACLLGNADGQSFYMLLRRACAEGNIRAIELAAQSIGLGTEQGQSSELNSCTGNRLPHGSPIQRIVVEEMIQAIDLRDLKLAHRIISALLLFRLREGLIYQVLLRSMEKQVPPHHEKDRLKIVQDLLSKGQANVNESDGFVVTQAVAKGRADLLQLFLQQTVSEKTFKSALEQAMASKTLTLRLTMIRLLAGTSRFAEDETLQIHGLSVASNAYAMDVLLVLAEAIKARRPFDQSLAAFVQTCERWRSSRGLYIVNYFLDHGASGPEVDLAFVQAAVQYDRDALELLATSASPKAFADALCLVIEKTTRWQLPESLWLFHELVEWTCDANAINRALILLVSAERVGCDTSDALQTLIIVGNGLDVNYQGGAALQKVAQRGNTDLLTKLLSHNAQKPAIIATFQAIIVSGLGDKIVLAMLDILFRSREECLSDAVEAPMPDGRSAVIAYLSTCPRSTAILRQLIQMGCDLTIHTKLRWGNGAEEYVPPLMWAICQRETKPLATEIIQILVNATDGALDFRSSVTGMTPLIAAVTSARKNVVDQLIAAKAETAVRDQYEHTALFYASQRGDLGLVQALLNAKAKVNDGSLHEASKGMHCQVVKALIKARHDTRFPSSLHQGRTALQEVCYHCDATRQHTVSLEATLLALEIEESDFMKPFNGRNSLFLALENSKPYIITKALLDVVAWRYLNDEKNIFLATDPKTSIQYVYSATWYLKHIYQGDRAHIPYLLKLLEEKQCNDRFYALYKPQHSHIPQPEHATGMPADIFAENTRCLAEHRIQWGKGIEYSEKLSRARHEAQHRQQPSEGQHRRQLRHQQEIQDRRNGRSFALAPIQQVGVFPAQPR